MKKNMMVVVKKLINLKKHYGVTSAPYYVMDGFVPYRNIEGHLIGLAEEIFEEDEDGEYLFCGYNFYKFSKLEREMLERAGF